MRSRLSNSSWERIFWITSAQKTNEAVYGMADKNGCIWNVAGQIGLTTTAEKTNTRKRSAGIMCQQLCAATPGRKKGHNLETLSFAENWNSPALELLTRSSSVICQIKEHVSIWVNDWPSKHHSAYFSVLRSLRGFVLTNWFHLWVKDYNIVSCLACIACNVWHPTQTILFALLLWDSHNFVQALTLRFDNEIWSWCIALKGSSMVRLTMLFSIRCFRKPGCLT